MRCLVVADLHYALQQYDWVIDVAPLFDVVVIAGDHLDLAGMVDRRTQSLVIRKYIDRLKDRARLIVCSGNHDLDSDGGSGEKTTRWILGARSDRVACDGDSVLVEDTLFSVFPWWDGPLARKAIADQLAADSARRGRRWVWVNHAPPDRSPVSWGGSRFFGDVEIAQAIARFRPDIVFSGHVHQSPFTANGSWVDRIEETWVFNVGHQFGAPPAHIVLDTESETALWFSGAGNQMVELRKPLARPVRALDALPDWLKGEGRPGAPQPA
jgi:Icc-related predicted phosphoesterase